MGRGQRLNGVRPRATGSHPAARGGGVAHVRDSTIAMMSLLSVI